MVYVSPVRHGLWSTVVVLDGDRGDTEIARAHLVDFVELQVLRDVQPEVP